VTFNLAVCETGNEVGVCLNLTSQTARRNQCMR